MKTMHCCYDPNNGKYYCSTKTQYGILYPDKCELILSHDKLFNYIKENQNKYCYALPILVSHEFKKRLKEEK